MNYGTTLVGTHGIASVVPCLRGGQSVHSIQHTTCDSKFIMNNFYYWRSTVGRTWRTGYYIARRLLIRIKIHAFDKHWKVSARTGDYHFFCTRIDVSLRTKNRHGYTVVGRSYYDISYVVYIESVTSFT